MNKNDFISNTEVWLVRNDIKDAYFIMSHSQISKTNLNHYIADVKSILNHKAPDLLDEFNQSIKESKVHGISQMR